MLTSPLCQIRHFRDSDLEQLFDYLQNMEARGEYFPFIMHSEHLMRKEFAETGFSEDTRERLGIFSIEGKLVGEIAHFKGASVSSREIGYFLFDQNARGLGYTSEAVRLLSDYLFRRKGELNRLEINMAVENLASERTAQKAGFSKDGTRREFLYMNGRHWDAHIYSMLRSDWQKAQAASAG